MGFCRLFTYAVGLILSLTSAGSIFWFYFLTKSYVGFNMYSMQPLINTNSTAASSKKELEKVNNNNYEPGLSCAALSG